MDALEKKELQRNRMKRYFIDSAKELIKEEGLENLTTKKIGDRAGYSYATIYNYFENFNELICICIEEFSFEMKEFLKERIKDVPDSLEKLRFMMTESLLYVYNNQKIYKLYLADSIDYNYFKEKKGERFYHPAYEMMAEIIGNVEEFKNYSDKEIYALSDLIFSLFHSKMQFYIIIKYPDSFEELKDDIMVNLDFLLEKAVK